MIEKPRKADLMAHSFRSGSCFDVIRTLATPSGFHHYPVLKQYKLPLDDDFEQSMGGICWDDVLEIIREMTVKGCEPEGVRHHQLPRRVKSSRNKEEG